MFLTKKNAVYFNKPKVPIKSKRILGGWADDQDTDKQQEINYGRQNEVKPLNNQQTIPVPNLLQGEQMSQFKDTTINTIINTSQKNNQQKYYFDWDELNDRTDIQCQKKIIQNIIQPGGIRIKPSQNMLSQFIKQTKGMQIPIIGSLLLSKIQVNYGFQIKAKSLYVIQYLTKKNQKYAMYFKSQSKKIQNSIEPQDNIENYRKILKIVLNSIGLLLQNNQNQNQNNNNNFNQKIQNKFNFVDPGYHQEIQIISNNNKNNDNNNNKQSSISTFLEENSIKEKKKQNKKKIIGPKDLKKKQKNQNQSTSNVNILDLDLMENNYQNNNIKYDNKNNIDLLQEIKQNQEKPLSFDDLIGNINSYNNKFQF